MMTDHMNKECTMPEQDPSAQWQQELNGNAVEPLLPGDKTIIGISLLTGLLLLEMLFIASRFFPLNH
jgi:hypothetical protein